ncbi:MAG: N-acetylmuramoyl-L-alanine amidase [Defluviitaleaceae bacterium]|nr:N-acetylmuramoyl-L-alanine amidase [Defluviitaleaceae bacterium]MCL2264366.1 N-acetylmuramoyl-L-alanine amidase [Defluviitaleaceae bacterium]
MAFQRTRGLNPDGVVGPLTWNALFSSQPVAPPAPPVPTAPPVPPPSQRWTIVLDPGHGGHDPGAVLGTRRESDDVLRLALAVRQLLMARGQNVVMTRDRDVFVTLSERSAISNRNNANLFLSIHRNASTSSAANGVENFVFTTAPNQTVQYAFNVLDEVVDAGVQSNRGVKRENFSVLRNTAAPAALLELGFITNQRDNQLFDQNFTAYATAIADGIMNTLRGQTGRQSRFYTVVSGDTLQIVAQRFGTTAAAITQLNKLGGAGISVGQVLRIP